ncbi:hypothetical protein TI39_contig594g00016 [Zymoseptoria brevis]|uniref:Uncharacterized protein n=1 Tax=Zymoseptoria brevis TaxID=1047168 RepID=A0A0F4GHQ0_9PEZI|nr:hypothetical protein TI39_contig594g00016 [Zymoseptoria brevis]
MDHPAMRITLAVSPPIFALGDSCTLTITANLDFTGPITIHTWPTVNLCIKDAGKRSGFVNRQIGGDDDQYLVTFYPNTPLTFTDEFAPASRPDRPLKPGHRYRFGLSETNSFSKWMHGTREEVLSTERKPFEYGPSKIVLATGDDLEI